MEREYPQEVLTRRVMSQVAMAEEKLVGALNDEQRKMLEPLMDKHLTLTANLECDSFTRGVRFGEMMMLEILDGDDGQNLRRYKQNKADQA